MNNSYKPASPVIYKPEYQHQEIGLTKREYFAAMAMQGLLSSDVEADANTFAAHSVKMADALLAELEK